MAAAFPAVAPARRAAPVAKLATTTPLVSVVIVNYRRWDETTALVQQLLGHDHIFRDQIEVIVVDNASPNDPREAVLKQLRQCRLVRLPENRGFSAGVNAGFDASQAPWLLVLNPDVIVCPGFVDMLRAAALDIAEDDRHGEPVGVVGFQLRNRDGSRQLSTGLFPSFSRMLLGLLRPRTVRKYFHPTQPDRQRVPWVTGSCMLFRRECLKQLNGFDEDYFLYYEDVDVCRRARAAGWAVCYDPALEAMHLDPLQNRRLTEPMRAITRHASLTYFHKHLGPWQGWGLAQIIRLEAVVRERWHRLRGRTKDAAICGKLREICGHMLRHQPAQARACLDETLRLAGMKS